MAYHPLLLLIRKDVVPIAETRGWSLRDLNSLLWLCLHCLKVWSTVKIRITRVLQNAIVPVGRPRPYSIIILNMRFIPKASLRASSQITASSDILEQHLVVKNSKPFALTPTWSLASKQTDCITAGMWKLPDSEHKNLYDYAMLDQRRRRWAALYKCHTNVLYI